MARIDGVPVSRAGWFLRTIYRLARRQYGQVPEPVTIQAHHPGILRNVLVFELGNQRVLRRLDPALRDLVLHRVSTEIGCSWCVDFGAMLSQRSGLSIERHQELGRYETSSAFSPVEKLAIAYADAATAQPMTVTDELVAELRQHLDDAQLVELTYVIALENQRSRFNHALGLTAQGFTSGVACAVPPATR
jgi:AhpD family alkylhydroperoxidase